MARTFDELDPPLRRSRRRYLLVLAALLALAAPLSQDIVARTTALFTDTHVADANVLSTGTLDISTTPATALLTAAALVPGAVLVASLEVENAGSVDFRYAITSTTTEDVLAGELELTVKSGVTDCSVAEFDTDGSVLYGPGVLGSSAETDLVGDPSSGSDAGDRTLAASATEDLCFRVALPLTATNAAQGQTTTATFTFVAEQTAHNP